MGRPDVFALILIWLVVLGWAFFRLATRPADDGTDDGGE